MIRTTARAGDLVALALNLETSILKQGENNVSKFVEFQVSVSGKPVFINPDQVTHVTDHGDGKTGILLSSSTMLEINGQLHDVVGKLSAP